MAWISVHEDVDGPKLRKLAKLVGCSRLEALGALVAIWLWSIKNADESGLIKSADRSDIADVISAKLSDGYSAKDVVDAMVDSGWIDEVDGDLYLHDWDCWQEMWYKYLNRRERDTERKRLERMAKKDRAGGNEAPGDPDDSAEAPRLDDTGAHDETDRGTKTPPKPKYQVAFEEFWSVYPRRIGKGEAYKKYNARRKDGYSDEQLVEAARRYAEECRRKGTEPEFIKHPKTFLSDTMPFTDYLPKNDGQQQADASDENPFNEYR